MRSLKCESWSHRRWRRRSRRARSRSGSMRAGQRRPRTPALPSPDLAGCASRRRTPTASGSSRSHTNIASWLSPRRGRSSGPKFPKFAGRRVAADPGLIVQVLPATQLVDLLDNVLLCLCRQADCARRNATNALVAHIRQPAQFLVELLVVLVVGEVRRLDTEEVGKGGHGGCRGVGAVA